LKNTLIIFLILSLYISQAGNFIAYYIQLWQVKNEIKKELLAGIPEYDLEVISNTGNIQWEEEGKEFYLNEELYDVVKTKQYNRHIYYYCLNDKKEKLLLKNFEKQLKTSHNQDKNKNSKQPLKLFFPDAFISYNGSNIFLAANCKKNYFNYTASLIHHTIDINIPPPRS
jgi:hypothetical protein